MKNCFIISGHLGSTYKAAEILANELGGENYLFDTAQGEAPADFGNFDNLIFGTNVRYLCLNKRFKKWAKKLKNNHSPKYVYVVGATGKNAAKYIAKAYKIVGEAKNIRYVGGFLNETGAAGMALNVIRSVKAGLTEDGLPLPKLERKELAKLAAEIVKGNRNEEETV